jgi:DNA primase large subunit
MSHLLDALAAGKDIGHYGRLVFAIVARYFLSADEVASLLTKDPKMGEREARGLLRQVEEHDYSPPRREKILAWQGEQEFQIIPEPVDSDAGNVYDDLRFPERVYEHIAEYYEEKSEE